MLKGHDHAHDAGAGDGAGQYQCNQCRSQHGVGNDGDARDDVENRHQHVPNDALPALALEGVDELRAAAQKQQHAKKYYARHRQAEQHAEPDRA